jgi:hypothetical protein
MAAFAKSWRGRSLLKLTKIDVAEAHLVTAVRSHFRGEHPASVYLLAASAREILTTLGEKTGQRTVLAGLAETTGTPLNKLIALAHEFAGFFKHADRNPTAVLEDFSEQDVEVVLQVACHDFFRIAKGLPIELQVYEAWYYARAYDKVSDAPFRLQRIIRNCIQRFPGIRSASHAEQKRIGLEQLEKVRLDPRLRMEILREVVLPLDVPEKSSE